jgi:hypothetical protein
MTNVTAFLIGLATSLAAIFYLMSIDEKRRRALGKKSAMALPKMPIAGWLLALLPGPALLLAGQTSAFLTWCGAFTICSWIMASRAPRAGNGG